MATEHEQTVPASAEPEVEKQIQEKTVTSNTEDQKVMEANLEEEEEKPVENGNHTEEQNVDVQASDNGIVDEEKKTAEANSEQEKEDTTKAENVTSTEEGPVETNAADTKTGSEEMKTEDEAQKKDGLGSTVAQHYNEIKAGSREGRKESRIFYLRNFNNWVKSVIISEYLEKIKRRKRTSDDLNVLDLACGKGGDLLKWQKGKVDHVIMADIAGTSIDHCNERYAKLEKDNRHRHTRDRLFSMESFAVDCTKELLKDKYKKPDIKIDMTSCQFAFHYSFESFEQADMMLRNACENLNVGGYFIGTTPDAQKLVKRIKGCKADSFGNSVFNIKAEDKEKFPLFCSKYMFYLEGVVDCPEFIVYLPALEKLAEKYSMKLVWKKNFHELFKQYERQYSSLLHKMNAMEFYPAKEGKNLSGGSESQYKCAKDFIDNKNGKHARVGTLSADEWEVAGLYLAFAFEKVAPPREGRTDEREDRKRHREDSSKSSKSKSRERHSHHDKRKSSDSTSAKRSKKEEEEVYEVKDEIYEDEDKTDGEPATAAAVTTNESKTETTTSEATTTDAVATEENIADTVTSEATPSEAAPSGDTPSEVTHIEKKTEETAEAGNTGGDQETENNQQPEQSEDVSEQSSVPVVEAETSEADAIETVADDNADEVEMAEEVTEESAE